MVIPAYRITNADVKPYLSSYCIVKDGVCYAVVAILCRALGICLRTVMSVVAKHNRVLDRWTYTQPWLDGK
jgi:hypothetical protein